MEQEIIDTEYLSVPEKNEIDKRESYKDIIRDITTRFNNLTKEDKLEIKNIAKELGVKMGSCARCYKDALLEIRNILGIIEARVEKDTGVGYKFVGKGNIQWHGPFGNIRLNEMTSLKFIEKYVEQNPGQKVYIKIENHDSVKL